MYLFFDTETTGLSRNSDHVVQLAWILANQRGDVVKEESHVIRPTGYTIPSSAAQIHGITTTRALEIGKPLKWVLERLTADAELAVVAVAHNLSFDLGILQSEYKKVGITFSFHQLIQVCTMKLSTTWCRLPKLNGSPGFKYPKLDELHYRIFGCSFDGAHDALADTQACMRCYFELVKLGVISEVQFSEGNQLVPAQAKTFVGKNRAKTEKKSSAGSYQLSEQFPDLARNLAERDQRVAELANQVKVLQAQLSEAKVSSSPAMSAAFPKPSQGYAAWEKTIEESVPALSSSFGEDDSTSEATQQDEIFPGWLTDKRRFFYEEHGYRFSMDKGQVVAVSNGGQRTRLFASSDLDHLTRVNEDSARSSENSPPERGSHSSTVGDSNKKASGKMIKFPNWLTVAKRRVLEEIGIKFLLDKGQVVAVSNSGQRTRLYKSGDLDNLINILQSPQNDKFDTRDKEKSKSIKGNSLKADSTRPWVLDKNNQTIHNRITGVTFSVSSLTYVSSPTPGYEDISRRLWIRIYDIEIN